MPAHNDLIEGRAAIEEALRTELDYFVELRRVVGEHLASGLERTRSFVAARRTWANAAARIWVRSPARTPTTRAGCSRS